MEVRGADDEDVYMWDLGESLNGDARLWFDHLAPGSVIGYDMFTDLLKNEWCENIDEPSEPQSSNDCDVEDKFDEDDRDYDDDISSDCPYQFDFSSPELMVSVLVSKFMSESSINRNVTEYLRSNHNRSRNEIEHGINRII